MNISWIWFIQTLSFIIYFTEGAHIHWMLYTNDETGSHCFLVGFRYFCRSTHDNISLLKKSDTICVHGRSWSFSTLEQNNITTDQLIQWLIPFHLIEQYAEYLNSTSKGLTHHITVCQCNQNHVGVNCEYQLRSYTDSVSSVIAAQLGRDTNSDIILTTFIDEMTCSSVNSLEWRQICDGRIDCPDASDEVSCYLLEFNECDPNEYQCRNGMCIPIEFIFDVSFDCMDLSDEQESSKEYSTFHDCFMESRFECHERLCKKNEFSCGDGSCVHWSALLNHEKGCHNLRHAAYLCETNDHLVTHGQAFIGICNKTNVELPKLENTSDCLTSFRHLLVTNQNKLTNEQYKTALNNIIERCPERILYSNRTIISPILNVFYNKSLILSFYQQLGNLYKQIPRNPHLYCFNGSLKCSGIQMGLEADFCIPHEQFLKLTIYPYLPISDLFCQMVAQQALQSVSSIPHSESRLNFFICSSTSDRIALRRVDDGYFDCLHMDDERVSVHQLLKPFRYRCQTVLSPYQYVSYSQIGNGIADCGDGSDEISHQIRWSIVTCDDNDNYGCWIFQADGVTEDRIKNVRLPFHRYCDSVWDTMTGDDERNCSSWTCRDGTYKCNRTGQCIEKTYFCDGEFDCDDGEDELHCNRPMRQWELESQCDINIEHFCITQQYVQNPNLSRPCIHYTKAGDGYTDCIGSRDERNVFLCPDHKPLGDRFLCDNRSKCINYTVLCDGIDNCLDRSDESICYWDRSHCLAGQFACASRKICRSPRCHPRETCPDKSTWFWCPNPITSLTDYRSKKYKRLSTYEQSCYGYSTSTQRITDLSMESSALSYTKSVQRTVRGFCNRGFYLHTDNDEKRVCFCPPSYYGDRCQYDSRRVTVRVLLDRYHRDDIPPVVTVLILLLCNHSEIIDHQYLVDWDAGSPIKHNAYLLYSRPRLKGFYSVRFEIYHEESFLAAWEYKISPFDFLPAYRLAKILRFPTVTLPRLCSQNLCKNNGSCYIMNDGQNLCLCQRGWYGSSCEKYLSNIKCASHSFARHRHVCICPYGYLPPHCYTRNTICNVTYSCGLNRTCHAISQLPPGRLWCLCYGLKCNNKKFYIDLHRKTPNQNPLLLQLFKISSDYPRLRQQILIHSLSHFPISFLIKLYFHRSLNEVIPEIGLFFTFQPVAHAVISTLHLLFINCSKSLRNYTVDLDVQPQRCDLIGEDQLHSVKFLGKFCQKSINISCFIFDHYICFCKSHIIVKSECIPYSQRQTICTHCHNQGYCLQGDLQNKSDFTCICPKCVSGKLCQFSPGRFSISLEYLIEKTQWGKYHFMIPSLFFIFAMILNGLCFITFTHSHARQSGTGVYLLLGSVLSQTIFIILFLRILYLYIARRIILNYEINRVLCKILPYLMISFNYTNLWLMTFVTIERALTVTIPTRFTYLRKPKMATVFCLLIIILTFSSNSSHIFQYKLVSHPDDDFYPWCISEIELNQQQLIQCISLTHQIGPFFINLISSVIIIIGISRSKANSHHRSTRNVLLQQARERIDLLLGPLICFLAQLPQLIILFLNICNYDSEIWFLCLILITYYLSFTPQMNIFFLYIIPSSLYKNILFRKTIFGKQIMKMLSYLSNKHGQSNYVQKQSLFLVKKS